jgi:hypothetical protein
VRELYGGADDGVFVKRIAEPENDDEYGSDYESEDAMKSLLITGVDGVCRGEGEDGMFMKRITELENDYEYGLILQIT